MSIDITPLIDRPALTVSNTEKVLVVADIHLGIEWDLYKSGITIPSQTEKRLERLKGYAEQTDPDRIVLLGDVKHNVPRTSWQEKNEVPYFLDALTEHASVDILPGNHDSGIESLLHENNDIKVHSSKGAVIDGVGYFHGHTWPAFELLQTEYVVTAHNHPTVRFTDSLGHPTIEPSWIRSEFNFDELSRYQSLDYQSWNNPIVFVMPAFNELCGGIAFNESLHEDLLGPVFSTKTFELDDSEVYLLDGMYLGVLKNIRKSSMTRKRTSRKVKTKKR
ncbi:metallophosphoesterase [Methanohalobium evestigatum Z-7303]|uniref:Metallophosphoesterase n=1 Tax=Methanohalobium evestigatum (strain ATCC BAA-1072 / DSM 3721 / NBRC 107634 / OCM 161 / Z-7303) TaxID=644295 RepID=D7E892_METEZ|nr:metallophosphoesterase [Methanohalobium evestigatum]ADI73434.1 metallophosphoesterase [Methanohalobium evestigatum Z-7303]